MSRETKIKKRAIAELENTIDQLKEIVARDPAANKSDQRSLEAHEWALKVIRERRTK